jgi:hypothetical protein
MMNLVGLAHNWNDGIFSLDCMALKNDLINEITQSRIEKTSTEALSC